MNKKCAFNLSLSTDGWLFGQSIHHSTKVCQYTILQKYWLPWIFTCKIVDLKIADEVCLHSTLRHIFLIMHTKLNSWQWEHYIVCWSLFLKARCHIQFRTFTRIKICCRWSTRRASPGSGRWASVTCTAVTCGGASSTESREVRCHHWRPSLTWPPLKTRMTTRLKMSGNGHKTCLVVISNRIPNHINKIAIHDMIKSVTNQRFVVNLFKSRNDKNIWIGIQTLYYRPSILFLDTQSWRWQLWWWW